MKQPLASLRIVGRSGQQNLQSHIAVEADVPPSIDDAHAAFAKFFEDLVAFGDLIDCQIPLAFMRILGSASNQVNRRRGSEFGRDKYD